MPARKRLIFLFWFVTSATLLAAVLAAPIRTSGFLTVSARPDCLRRNFALVPNQPTARLSTGLASEAVAPVSVFLVENEEQDWADALSSPRASYLTLCWFGTAIDRALPAPRPALCLFPLRC